MQILSAVDCITPAFARTKAILFKPFRWGSTWKLAATGYLAASCSAFLPFPLIYLGFIPIARSGGSGSVLALVICVLVLTAIYLVVYYLCSRLRFAFFDIVLNREAFVAPAWRKYGRQSFRWTAFKVALGTLFSLLLAGPLVAIARQVIPVFSTLETHMKPGQPPPPEVMTAIFSMYAAFGVVYLAVGLFFFFSSIMGDFVIPSLALEDTTLAVAFCRFGMLIRNEPGQVSLYALLKLGLGLAAYTGGALVGEIAFFLAAIIVGLFAAAIGYLLHLASVPPVVLMCLGILLAMALYLFFVFYCVFILAGTVSTFLESYMLYFLGGRYPLLGNLLEASTPAPVYANPIPTSYGIPYSPPPPPTDPYTE